MARWITGAFRTTPVGALELAAGLIPIKNSINQLMHKSAYRVHTLHNGHPIRAHLPDKWATNMLNITAPFPYKERKTVDADTPIKHIHNIAHKQVQEKFHLLDNINRPGDRILDAYNDNIEVIKCPFKKGSEEFVTWTSQVFEPHLKTSLSTKTNITVFSDGSQVYKSRQYKTAHSINRKTTAGSATIVYFFDQEEANEPIIIERATAIGRATPYDAEMTALAMGISIAVAKSKDHTESIAVFADNLSALQTIMNPKKGASQIRAVQASRQVKKFIDGNPSRKVYFLWVPAHVGIELNEKVDKLAKKGARTRKHPNKTSLAFAQQLNKQAQLDNWRQLMSSRKYRGKGLPQGKSQAEVHELNTELTAIKHSAKSWFLRKGHDNTSGDKPRNLARLVRFLTNHAPIGSYRERFNKEGQQICMACDKKVMETRDHMVYECPGWTHGFINKISTNEKRSPAYKYANSISHRTQSGHEVIIGNLMAWSYRADYEQQPHMREYYRAKIDHAIRSLMEDPIDILKELYTEEWAIYQDFLNLNPMAATFA